MPRKILYSFLVALISFSSYSKDYTYTGTIGKYPVFLLLNIQGDKVIGKYCYVKELTSIYFGGELKKGVITLETNNVNDYIVSEERFIPEKFKLNWTAEKVTGKWTYNGKSLSVDLAKASEKDLDIPKIKNNPFLQEQDDYEQLRIGQFKLKEVDSLETIGQVKVRSFEEINTGIVLYRIDSGLNSVNLEKVNHYLEFLHVYAFLSYFDCKAESEGNFNYDIGFYDLTVSDELFSIAVFKTFNCGYPRPDEDNYGINLDLENMHLVRSQDFIKAGKEELFQKKVVQYFKTKHASDFNEENDLTDCDYANEDLWTTECKFVFTSQGLELLPSFPHSRAPCMAPEWAIVPYSVIKDLIYPEFWVLLNGLKP